MKLLFCIFSLLYIVKAEAQLQCGGLIRAASAIEQVVFSVEDRQVKLNLLEQSFDNEQTWFIRGATREQLMAVRSRLTFTGKYGVMDMEQIRLMDFNTPEELQNILGHVDVQKARPRFLPEFFGSRAQTFLTDYGFDISMSEGKFGNGGSRVIFEETYYDRDGTPITPVREIGRYTVAPKLGGVCAPFCFAANMMARFSPVGWAMSAPALKFMGELHNRAFNAGKALAAAVKDLNPSQP